MKSERSRFKTKYREGHTKCLLHIEEEVQKNVLHKGICKDRLNRWLERKRRQRSGGGKFRHPYVFQMTNNVSLGLAIPVSLMVVEAPL
jgi:hypothetical protein